VATVASVDRRVDSGFARVLLAPAAGIDGVRHVLVLEPLSAQLPPIPELAASTPKAAAKGGKAKASAGGAAP
jgi:rod shape-determining protein MreC